MSKKSVNAAADDLLSQPESFESAMAELEALVDGMDEQGLGLDQLVKDYKRGALLVKYCRDRLQQVREEVKQIEAGLASDAGGDPS
ncbi:exodeoxyribonuclease VII small subunit [Limnobacter humi]|uniref:Exodeoxyribonuclease 7 small subunit n=1 Tax=Limnobacter humi TaxID=1778671 RepID=A0ABT1WGA5_9BURK|nr:exodeoxyribonuclease VII small subunit [Limnobacter humi]MCQ8896546.1 exodeoxyribonuclease VII small subunit [Limnobacter humi]